MVNGLKNSKPNKYKEAQNKEEWWKAMDEEYQSIMKNDTWELVMLPEGKSAIGTQWIYKIKYLSNREIERHKARLVVKGYP